MQTNQKLRVVTDDDDPFSDVKPHTVVKATSEKPSASSKVDDETSAEHDFANTLKTIGYEVRDELPYLWNGSFWKYVDDQNLSRTAARWLMLNRPKSATEPKKKSCIAFAKSILPELHEQDGQQVIPLMNAYLHLDLVAGRAMVKECDKRCGMTWAINIKLEHPDYGSYYAPSQLPTDSLFHRFITTSIDDEETRGGVQEFVGSSLITKNFQTALFLYGESAGNGKGTLMNIVQALHNKVATVDLEEFNRFTMASLFGASLVVVDEMPKSIDRGVQKVKSAMTSDTISVERKGKDAVSYRSTAKWIVASNHAPATDNSKGWWRRLLIVPFNKSFTDSGEAIKGLEQMIVSQELNLVLDWAIEGLFRLVRRGDFVETTAMREAKRQMQIESDSVLGWIDEKGVTFDPRCETDKGDIYKNYDTWAWNSGLRAVGRVIFWKRMRMAFPQINDKGGQESGGKRWVPLKLEGM